MLKVTESKHSPTEPELYVLVPRSNVVASSSPSAARAPDREVVRSDLVPEHKEEKKELTGIPLLGLRTMGESKRASKGAMDLPPPLLPTCVVKHKFRFRCSSALAGQAITLANLLGSFGGICTVANSTIRTWCSSFRIRSISAWLPGGVTGGSNYCFVDWAASGNANFMPDIAKVYTVPDGVTVTGHLDFKPPKESLAAFWFNTANLSTTAAVAGITCPAGTIFDLVVDFTLGNVSGGVNITVVAGSVGTIYYLALDGPSSNKLVPLGLPTTA